MYSEQKFAFNFPLTHHKIIHFYPQKNGFKLKLCHGLQGFYQTKYKQKNKILIGDTQNNLTSKT